MMTCRFFCRLLALAALCLLTACATPRNNYDPLESINRPVYRFNKALDDNLVRPVAKAWSDYIPTPIKKGVHNFFGNVGDLMAIPAAILQGKGDDASLSLSRVLINTTVGLGGLIDWASDLEIQKSTEDFGQVLGFWGVPSGPYLMLPFLGPTTIRDSVDPALRFTYGPTNYIDPERLRYVYTGINVIDIRAELLPIDKMLEEQYDQYAFLRDTYLQNRWFKIHDGNPPKPLPMAADVEDDEIDPPPASESKTPTPQVPVASAPAAQNASEPAVEKINS